FLWTGCLLRPFQASGFIEGYRPRDSKGSRGFSFLIYWKSRKESPYQNEGWYSPRLQRNQCDLRLRPHLQDKLDAQGRYSRGNLLFLPPVLYRPSEADRYRRARRQVRKKVQGDARNQEGRRTGRLAPKFNKRSEERRV